MYAIPPAASSDHRRRQIGGGEINRFDSLLLVNKLYHMGKFLRNSSPFIIREFERLYSM